LHQIALANIQHRDGILSGFTQLRCLVSKFFCGAKFRSPNYLLIIDVLLKLGALCGASASNGDTQEMGTEQRLKEVER
jgi:hypothetical protein